MVSGRRRLVSMAAATGALGACCLSAVGCGGGSATPDPLANQTAATVMAEAIANLKAAPSVTVNTAGIDSGAYISGYMRVDPGKGCTGTTMLEGLTAYAAATYITIGQTTYVKPDSLMWQGLAGSDATTISQKVGSRYVEDPVSDGHLYGLGTCLIDALDTSGVSVTKDQVTMLNGVRVLQLKDSGGDVIYVTDTSKPEVVQFDHAPVPGTTDPGSEATYTIGAPVKLTPPPASQVVSGASIHF